jgi:hypothetical protein
MALEDFDTHDSTEAQVLKATAAPVTAPVRKTVAAEDEDLFDFPVVEMRVEADAARKSATPMPPATVASQAKPASEPAAAPQSAAASAPAAVKTPASAAAASGTAAAAKADLAKPVPAKTAPAKEARKSAGSEAKLKEQDVAQAAQLVEDIEHVLGADGQPGKRKSRILRPSPLVLAGVALLVLINVFGLVFLWRTTQAFQSGVQAMNEQFAESLRRQTEAPAGPDTSADPAHSSASSGRHAAGDRTQAPAREAFELSALHMAREEIQAGEYAAARRRLSRLLAVADRIEAGQRGEIEAQAAFLIAGTYRKQAEAAREESP